MAFSAGVADKKLEHSSYIRDSSIELLNYANLSANHAVKSQAVRQASEAARQNGKYST